MTVDDDWRRFCVNHEGYSGHFNVGTWPGMKRVPPKMQIIIWRRWRGVRWHRWKGGGIIDTILRGSLMLGWIELRFWRRPSLHTTVSYPDAD